MLETRINGKLNVTVFLRPDIVNYFTANDLKRLYDIISWNNFKPDSLSQARHAIMNLTNPVNISRDNSLDGVTTLVYDSLKIKGVHFKDPVAEVRKSRLQGTEDPSDTTMPGPKIRELRYGELGWSMGRIHYDARGVFTTKHPFKSEKNETPFIVCAWDKVLEEFEHTKYMFDSGLNVCLPVGYAKFDNLKFERKPTGCLIFAIPNKDDFRMMDQLILLEQKEPRTKRFYEQIFYNLGMEFRHQLRAGVTTDENTHLDDVALDENNGFTRLYIHDQNNSFRLNKLTPKQLFGYFITQSLTPMIWSVRGIDSKYSKQPSDDGEISRGWAAVVDSEAKLYNILAEKGARPLKSFLNGFFYDDNDAVKLLLRRTCELNANILYAENAQFIQLFDQNSPDKEDLRDNLIPVYDLTTQETLRSVVELYPFYMLGLRVDDRDPRKFIKKHRLTNPMAREEYKKNHKAFFHKNSPCQPAFFSLNSIPYLIKAKEVFDKEIQVD